MDLHSAWKTLIDAPNDDFLAIFEGAQIDEMMNKLMNKFQTLTNISAVAGRTPNVGRLSPCPLSVGAHASTLDRNDISLPSPYCPSIDRESHVPATNWNTASPSSSSCPTTDRSNDIPAASCNTSLPPQPFSSADRADDVLAADHNNDSLPPPPYSPTDKASDALAVRGCEKLLSTLLSKTKEIRRFTRKKAIRAVGKASHEEQDYRLIDLFSGTRTYCNDNQTMFRSVLAERSLALAFEQWELGQNYPSRVQLIVEDSANAQLKRTGATRFVKHLGISGGNIGAVSRHVHRGIKCLVIERLLKNRLTGVTDDYEETGLDNDEETDPDDKETDLDNDGETDLEEEMDLHNSHHDGLDGVAVFAAFAYRLWQTIKYNDIPIFIKLFLRSSELLTLAKSRTTWLKKAQRYYDTPGLHGTKRKRQQETSSREETPTSNPQRLAITMPLPYSPALPHCSEKPRRRLIPRSSKPANTPKHNPPAPMLQISSADSPSSQPYSQSSTHPLRNVGSVPTQDSDYSYGHPPSQVNGQESVCQVVGNGV